MTFVILLGLTASIVTCVASSNPVPIPARPHGLTYYTAGHQDYMNPVLLEAFIEVACVDAKIAFPVLLDVANHYDGKVKLVFYQFPLPYHRAAMHGAQTLRIVSEIAPTMVLCYLETAFQNQDDITDRNIVNKTETELISIFADHAEQCGVSREDYYRLFEDRFGSKDARAEWKYGCSRGVCGTPHIFLNGVFLTNDQTWTVEDYIEIIDGLDDQ